MAFRPAATVYRPTAPTHVGESSYLSMPILTPARDRHNRQGSDRRRTAAVGPVVTLLMKRLDAYPDARQSETSAGLQRFMLMIFIVEGQVLPRWVHPVVVTWRA